MNTNKLKNILIGMLVLIAVYQTSQLWFEDISNHNFFYSFLSKTVDINATEQKTSIATPYRLITNFGNNNYSVVLNDKTDRPEKEDFNAILVSLFKKGEFVTIRDINWDDMLKGRSYIFEYKIPVFTQVFMQDLGLKNNIISSKVVKFDSIIIINSRTVTEKIRVLFINKEENSSYEFVVDKPDLSNKMNENIQNLQNLQTNEMYANPTYQVIYKSSDNLKSQLFASNMFLPTWQTPHYEYTTIKTINPYLTKDGEARLRFIEDKVNIFFDNPNAKREEPSKEQVFTFSDENIVVRYLSNNTLEYSNYDLSKTKKKTFIEDYNTAVKFISKDKESINKALIEEKYLLDYEFSSNDFFLADYIEEDDKRTFYFDIAVNEFPVFLSNELKKQIKMDHHIKIEVENGRVVKYNKLVYQYQIDYEVENNEMANVDYLEAINKFIDVNDDGSNKVIQNIELGYKVDESSKISENNKLTLHWILQISDTINITSAQNKGL